MNLQQAIFGILLFAVTIHLPAFAEDSIDREQFKAIYNHALAANAAYRSHASVDKQMAALGYEVSLRGQLPGYAVSYFLATSHLRREQMIVVRGTSNMENAVVNIAFKLLPNAHTGIRLHQGFANAADYIYAKIEAALIPAYRINTTGHSLGGAAALILAMYLDADGYEVGHVTTFGQPKVTNVSGSRKYGHLNVLRVVTPGDVVPMLPPLDPMELANLDIYWHQGTEIILWQGNDYSMLTGLDSVVRVADFMNGMISEESLQQHFMSAYINALSPKLVNARRIPYQRNFSLSDLPDGSGKKPASR